MSQLGQYKTPGELKDEDKWFKFFTKKQLVIAIVVLIIDWNIAVIFNKIHLIVIGITLDVFITIVMAIITLLPMPANKHIFGGGLPLYRIAYRILIRKLFNKHIYTTMYEEEIKENKQ